MAFVLVECALALALTGAADLSDVVEHVSWTVILPSPCICFHD